MEPSDFLKTLYFGDRVCNRIVFDCNKNQVEIHINRVSRIRDPSGVWNYYQDEDIENGIVVITNVSKCYTDKSGLLPNDQIYGLSVRELDEAVYEFLFEACNIDAHASSTDVEIRIIGEGIHLVDPSSAYLKTTG